jgi:RNA polymerase sigma-32 factor
MPDHFSASSSSIALQNPWAMAPSLGDLNAYISAANRMPMLTLEQEQMLSRKFRADGDVEAASKLVLSHLRLVISVSRQYLGYGLAHGDLIQEGNVGLMKAVKRFDPDHGVRLVSYALFWIKAEIHEFVLKNWRMVKVASTKAQRKLFFNLRSMKQRMRSDDAVEYGRTHGDSLSEAQIAAMACELGVKREEVVEMEMRISGGDVVLEAMADEDGDNGFGAITYLADNTLEPTQVIEARQRDLLESEGVCAALAALDARSRHIVEERWLNVNDDTSGAMTLQELASIHGVSAERVRQIEAAAMKKMRATLAQYA